MQWPPSPGAGIESLETERLGLRCVDYFVDIDAHAHAELFEFVDQGNVDAAINVFEQLGHFGDRRAADGHDTAENGPVHRGSQLDSDGAAPSYDLGNVMAGDGVVAGIFALGREGDVDPSVIEGARHLEAMAVAGFQQGHHHLFGSAGIGGAFKHDQLVLVNVGRNGFDGAGDVAEVGFMVFVERRGARR